MTQILIDSCSAPVPGSGKRGPRQEEPQQRLHSDSAGDGGRQQQRRDHHHLQGGQRGNQDQPGAVLYRVKLEISKNATSDTL